MSNAIYGCVNGIGYIIDSPALQALSYQMVQYRKRNIVIANNLLLHWAG